MVRFPGVSYVWGFLIHGCRLKTQTLKAMAIVRREKGREREHLGVGWRRTFKAQGKQKDFKCIKKGLLGLPGAGERCGLCVAKWPPNGVFSIQNSYQQHWSIQGMELVDMAVGCESGGG